MLQWYLRSSLWVSLCLAKADALEKTFEQTLHDCGEALDPEEEPDFRVGVVADGVLAVVVAVVVVDDLLLVDIVKADVKDVELLSVCTAATLVLLLLQLLVGLIEILIGFDCFCC